MIARRLRMNSASKSNVKNLIQYLTCTQGHEQRVGEIRTCNCYSDDPMLAGIEMSVTQRRNYRAKGDKTYHLILSFREDENPNPETLHAIEDEVCEALGFGEHERLSVVHMDTDNLHIHLCINKIHPQRLTMHEPYYDHKTLAATCTRLEQKYGLQLDNHTFQAQAVETPAKSMEIAGDMESLIGWIQRNILEDMQKATTWSELHETLATHGLSIKERGNGLIVSNGSIHVKASSLHRSCSKKNLESRLGTFEKSVSKTHVVSTSTYQKKPMQHQGMDSSNLWNQFQKERERHYEERKKRSEKARLARNTEMQEVIADTQLLNTVTRYLVQDPAMRRIIYALNSSHASAQKKSIKQKYQQEKANIPKKITWRNWLQNEALAGSLEALKAMRARDKRKRMQTPVRTADKAVVITRRGTRILANGLRDTGHDAVLRKCSYAAPTLEPLVIIKRKAHSRDFFKRELRDQESWLHKHNTLHHQEYRQKNKQEQQRGAVTRGRGR